MSFFLWQAFRFLHKVASLMELRTRIDPHVLLGGGLPGLLNELAQSFVSKDIVCVCVMHTQILLYAARFRLHVGAACLCLFAEDLDHRLSVLPLTQIGPLFSHLQTQVNLNFQDSRRHFCSFSCRSAYVIWPCGK